MEKEAAFLKIPGKVLFDLYSNGKRCIVRFPVKAGNQVISNVFDIICASKRYTGKNSDQLTYHFLATYYNRPNVQTLKFESGADDEPMSI
jgi:hypothetical protein